MASLSTPLNWTDKTFFFCAVTLYGIGMIYSLFLWRKGFQRDDWVVYGVLGGGWMLHTNAMVQRGFSLQQCPITNLYEATAFIMWTIVVGYLLLGLRQRFRFIGAFASPLLFVLGVFALFPDLDPDLPVGKHEFSGMLSSLHKALLLLSFGALGLCAVAAAMYLTQEHDLKLHKFRAILSRLPSLQRLEQAMKVLMRVGVGLLTLGVVASYAYHFQPDKTASLGDPMVIWILVVWIFYSVISFLHWRQAHGGKRFAWASLGGFIFMMLTFWGAMLSHLQKT
jgi:ABC-type uncharacterized transport system permease subunit